ncbi:nucleoside 2-deoxyribosyltransferase [Aquisalimonas asiatica]|uniref:Nucleoside 2-deoxyribosyltransferase n=1 Tax=Aquisalimonas asiatica TaxID=406100 RepID=A0A1H8TJB2_9GAMM|nr:nucleoside 2-deoxyribosyltransferase [Aquisalimonas asiatica]SEO90901.1 Nucleoside 2-deoxyribosyltransferase [Aquisalimonas asiatica]
MRCYFAGALFNLAEKRFNRELTDAVRARYPGVEFILPQERAAQFLHLEDWSARMFADCIAMIDASDVVVTILDGPDADSGTSLELGYAYARGMPIIGIRTDFRGSEDRGLNLMLANVCTTLLLEPLDDLGALADQVADALRALPAEG